MGPWRWTAPLHRSRCGASHQRRGVPCQDASLCASLRSADGLPVGLMAVADGHGGSRYWLSDVGSRLACELAIAMAAEDLARRPWNGASADQLEVVRGWLADDLPARLVAAWQQAIEADWQQRELPEAHQGEHFSSQTYGSTLALVVLTPHWWAHTGVGDWDLVLLSNHQPDQILSQEADQGLQGEATTSLCLPRASRCFAARTAVYRLSGEPHQACGLVLSTDGIRKSCATDADHLALSRYLLEEAQLHQAPTAGPTERLDASLDRISREGSGDDVSVALACFGTLLPVGEAAAGAELPPLPPLPELDVAPLAPRRPRSNKTRQRPQQRKGPNLLPISLVVLAGASLSLAVWVWLKPLALWRTSATSTQQPFAPWPLTLRQRNGITLEISKLCAQDLPLIQATLKQRKQIRANHRTLQHLLAEDDWLGSLILLSRPGDSQLKDPFLLCPRLQAALTTFWAEGAQAGATAPPPLMPVPATVSIDTVPAAMTSIQALYAALSARDYGRAARYYGAMAADQFDAAFFNQFERVTVTDLHQTSDSGSMVHLEGVVTFVLRNGDVQIELRRFTVDTRATPALITSSEFRRVLQPR